MGCLVVVVDITTLKIARKPVKLQKKNPAGHRLPQVLKNLVMREAQQLRKQSSTEADQYFKPPDWLLDGRAC